MIVQVDGIKEYLIICIGIGGEIEEKWFNKTLNEKYSSRYIKNEINKCAQEKIINKTKQGTIRLKKPNGLYKLKALSPELYDYYMIMTNQHQFPGGKVREKRREKNTKLIETFLREGILIDYHTVTIKSSPGRKRKKAANNNIENMLSIPTWISEKTKSILINGKIKPLKEQFLYVADDEFQFFTNKVLHAEKENEHANNRKSASRIFGSLVGFGNVFMVYVIDSDFKWSPRTESQAAMIINNEWRQVQEVGYEDNIKGNCIIYYTDNNALKNMGEKIISTKKVKGVRPWEIYDSAYFIPLEETLALKLLHGSEFQVKQNELIFGENATRNSFYDALLNGNPAWNIITNDVVKIRKIKTLEEKIISEGNEIILVAQKWQEDFLKRIFNDPKLILLSDKEVETIAKNMEV